MKKILLFTAGILMIAISLTHAQVPGQCYKTNNVPAAKPQTGIKMNSIKPLKNEYPSFTVRNNAKMHDASNIKPAIFHQFRKQHRKIAYTNAALTDARFSGNNFKLAQAPPAIAAFASNDQFNEINVSVPETATVLSNLECGLDADGLSFGLNSNTCISLDVAGYFSAASDTSHSQSDSINSSFIDPDLSVGIVLQIK